MVKRIYLREDFQEGEDKNSITYYVDTGKSAMPKLQKILTQKCNNYNYSISDVGINNRYGHNYGLVFCLTVDDIKSWCYITYSNDNSFYLILTWDDACGQHEVNFDEYDLYTVDDIIKVVNTVCCYLVNEYVPEEDDDDYYNDDYDDYYDDDSVDYYDDEDDKYVDVYGSDYEHNYNFDYYDYS